jgi:hypothetical protein
MEAEYCESYVTLSSLKAGDVAVSKHRDKLFVCSYIWNKDAEKNELAIFDINNMADQYSDKRDMSQPVKKLDCDDKFIITI